MLDAVVTHRLYKVNFCLLNRERRIIRMANRKLKIHWGNHPSTLQTMFQKALEGGHFADVTLTSGDGQSIKCHRPILVACSAYFDRILSAHPNDSLIIFLRNIKHWQLEALVEIMYSGKVCVTQQQLPELHKAANELEIKGLGLPDEEVGPKQRNDDHGGQPMKRKAPPNLVKMEHVERSSDNGSDMSLQEEVKRSALEAESAGLVQSPKTKTGRPMDDEDREDRVEKASESVVGGLTARAVAAHFDVPRTTLRERMKLRFLRLPGGDEDDHERQVGQPTKKEPPKLVKMERSSSDGSAQEENGQDEVKKKGKGGIALPPKTTTERPVDAEDRAERFKKASEFVVGGMTARSVAIHFDIPRTTLLKYMKRHGLSRAKKDDTPSPPPGSSTQSTAQSEAGSAASANEDFPLFGLSNVMMVQGK